MEITLEYNARNKTAKGIIDVILAMEGIFKVKGGAAATDSSGLEVTRKAILEAEQGDVIVCDSFEDYLKNTRANA